MKLPELECFNSKYFIDYLLALFTKTTPIIKIARGGGVITIDCVSDSATLGSNLSRRRNGWDLLAAAKHSASHVCCI